MTLPPHVVNDLVKIELEKCQILNKSGRVEISDYDGTTQIFTVILTSTIDEQKYFLEVKCDNYNEWPPLLEFFTSDGIKGTKNAYPKCSDSFFHTMPCICNPCSRKSYFTGGPHSNDWNLIGWKQNEKVNSLTNLFAILDAISKRINHDQFYEGRMT